MKNVLKRIATVASVMALIVVTSICMTACGNGSDNTNTNICNIDNLNGYYGNAEEQTLYYFDIANNKYDRASIYISEQPNENGLYTLKTSRSDHINSMYRDKLRISRGSQGLVVYKVWDMYPGLGDNGGTKYNETKLIGTYQNPNNTDLSKQFYADDEELIYTKISSLNEFLAEAFPGKEIDTTDMTYVSSSWKDLFLNA